MAAYTVTWTINIEAESALEAAIEARQYQEPGTEALVFDVVNDKSGESESIDLFDVPYLEIK